MSASTRRGAARLTEKQLDILMFLGAFEEVTPYKPYKVWMSASDIGHTNRKVAERGGWISYVDWMPSGVIATLRRLEKRGLVERRTTGLKGRGEPHYEWSLTDEGLVTWQRGLTDLIEREEMER